MVLYKRVEWTPGLLGNSRAQLLVSGLAAGLGQLARVNMVDGTGQVQPQERGMAVMSWEVSALRRLGWAQAQFKKEG